MSTLFRKVVIVTLLSMGIAGAAQAQYVWLDEKGTKQFSDLPPPVSVPPSRILKQPRGARSLEPVATAPSASASPGNETAAPMTTAEKNAEFRKRQNERAEKEKKASEEAKLASEKMKQCERAREYHRSLESGERISRKDKDGERSYLTDEQRANEIRDAQRVLSECKS
ncbi:DUF4124 domain-containing protein [Noviherbaspirillum saxi]|uniref:DUF4124 domain-containing protein n=2 Tax=Noviherbaspirillum saxi TaxID=2320863 RepID=A0A3A3FLU9_9BURK|nr:DUF4124 domain-containing protein [Noviherbaspirillum saxi]